jgi:NAD(P)H-hydrate epimerase
MIRLTREQVREIDRRSIEEYHIPGVVLMENAARGAAEVACDMVSDSARPEVLVVCGGGNNGGDGFAIARHLHNRGVAVQIMPIVDEAKLRGDALLNWRIVKRMGLPCTTDMRPDPAPMRFHLTIDAVYGTGLTTPPRPPFHELVEFMEWSSAEILAVDLPSGLDCDTGVPLGPECVRATRTVTFVAEKAGFANPASRQYTGEITVADIGCPRELIEEVAGRSG